MYYSINLDNHYVEKIGDIYSLDTVLSPDESKIAFSYFEGIGGIKGIKILTLDTKKTIKLVEGDVSNPSWHPSNEKIAFDKITNDERYLPYKKTFDIYSINIDGTNEKRLTDLEENEYGPAWSPDGTRIAYYTTNFEGIELWIMDSDGYNKKKVTSVRPNTKESLEPKPIYLYYMDITSAIINWDNDGEKITYSVSVGDTAGLGVDSGIYLVNSDGSNKQLILDSKSSYPYIWNGHLSFAPDGSKLAFTKTISNSNPNESGVWRYSQDIWVGELCII